MSEGMNAVYRFESKITNSTGAANGQTNGNFAFVGLTGGFGGFALGKQNNAAYNHAGAIRDISNWHSYGDTDGSKTANSLSYWYDSESIKLQVAAVMDGGKNADTDGAIDRVEFGLTVGLGDLGKVAIGYEKQEDSMTEMAVTEDTVDIIKKNGTEAADIVDGVVTNTGNYFGRLKGSEKAVVLNNIMLKDGYMVIDVYHEEGDPPSVVMMDGGKYYGGTTCSDEDARNESNCKTAKKYLVMVGNAAAERDKPDSDINPTYEVVTADETLIKEAHTATYTVTDYGYKASHISASFGLAGITVALGHTTKDSNSPMMNDKEKTNFLGASGSIGDTGLSWNAWGRNVKNNGHKSGDDRSPWTVGLGKSLGGGAHTFIEHYNADDGEDGTTSVALRVDF